MVTINDRYDVGLWCVLTDLQPHHQAAALVTRLQGQAREIANALTPRELAAGILRDGVYYDPVSHLMGLWQSALHRWKTRQETMR